MGLMLSFFAVLFLQLFIKVIDIYFKGIVKRDLKRSLDIQRAFKALRIIAGPQWEEIREEIMKDEKFES